MTTRAFAAVALLAMTAGMACSARADGPPHIEEDRTACAHCGMLISERMFAAAYRAPGAEARVFDDIGCLLTAARAEQNAAAFQYWFHDARTRAWIDGARAVIIHSPTLNTPMGGGMLAYDDAAAAAEEAAAHRGRVIGGLDRLLAGPPKEGAS